MLKLFLAAGLAAVLAGGAYHLPASARGVACDPPASEYATCTGSSSCRACKNCKYCGHCAQRGGTCGVCATSPSK